MSEIALGVGKQVRAAVVDNQIVRAKKLGRARNSQAMPTDRDLVVCYAHGQ
jgi:hypothetical protein